MLTVSVLLETAMPDDEREPLYQVDHQCSTGQRRAGITTALGFTASGFAWSVSARSMTWRPRGESARAAFKITDWRWPKTGHVRWNGTR